MSTPETIISSLQRTQDTTMPGIMEWQLLLIYHRYRVERCVGAIFKFIWLYPRFPTHPGPGSLPESSSIVWFLTAYQIPTLLPLDREWSQWSHQWHERFHSNNFMLRMHNLLSFSKFLVYCTSSMLNCKNSRFPSIDLQLYLSRLSLGRSKTRSASVHYNVAPVSQRSWSRVPL